jgi:hypothetical protein
MVSCEETRTSSDDIRQSASVNASRHKQANQLNSQACCELTKLFIHPRKKATAVF